VIWRRIWCDEGCAEGEENEEDGEKNGDFHDGKKDRDWIVIRSLEFSPRFFERRVRKQES